MDVRRPAFRGYAESACIRVRWADAVTPRSQRRLDNDNSLSEMECSDTT